MTRGTAVQVRTRRRVVPEWSKSGERSAEYQVWLRALLQAKGHRSAFKTALTHDKHPHFAFATKHAAAYAIGLPVQPMVDLTPREPVSLTATQLVDALPRLVRVLPGAAKVLQAIEVSGSVVD
jgi:hypothetical protein